MGVVGGSGHGRERGATFTGTRRLIPGGPFPFKEIKPSMGSIGGQQRVLMLLGQGKLARGPLASRCSLWALGAGLG